MGGIGTGVRLEAVEPPAGKKRSTPRALHTAISRAILDRIWKGNVRGAFRGTAGMYLGEERSEGVRSGLWDASPTELGWAFMDHAGCCNGSSQACWHWFHVALVSQRARWDKMAAGRGWRITDPVKAPTAALFGVDYPLVDMGGQPMCVPRLPWGKPDWDDDWSGPFWDDGSPRPTRLSAIDEPGRTAVTRAAITGMCACGLCAQDRPWRWDQSELPVLADAWLALGEDARCTELAAEVQTEVTAYAAWREAPAGPPTLQVLTDRLRDRSAKVPLAWELAGMCFGAPKRR